MKPREKTPTDPRDIAMIRGMLARGDTQSNIAAFFGTNGGRICEINTGRRNPEVPSAPIDDRLPPPGPYLAARSAIAARDTLITLRDLIDDLVSQHVALRDLIGDCLTRIEVWETPDDEPPPPLPPKRRGRAASRH